MQVPATLGGTRNLVSTCSCIGLSPTYVQASVCAFPRASEGYAAHIRRAKEIAVAKQAPSEEMMIMPLHLLVRLIARLLLVPASLS